ncbi:MULTISPECIES: SH3 domain-containing protein [Devosia]|uniref:Bacterial SH3 domain protein n=1 Tax=Devosia equisanguinis TaxID=2490941 RepID=A0A3S5D3P9_9HYPH|nr:MULTISPECIES: SH3 domain-containing protein [Devosia]ODT50451.1 MAG: hypothetical protein ABS74_02720 [Pelagibacterium sp. SCN 63-126]ODU88531.1 MAG: hypothetical protein ABT14_02320 [Pelagibacterium sp. SCN 63-17]OJX45598.1 MAG: hypothetical protein BGO80_07325 [Devosia sp. 63-57]VDS06637.1 Bacterial SH3 domain protein [Devosia equisanguinis]
MITKRLYLAAAVAAATLASTAVAFAQPGIATNAVNVRSGPGTNYAKLGALSAGEIVDVQQCQGSWCYVDRSAGKDGWVSKNYLQPYQPSGNSGGGNKKPDIPFSFGMTIGPGGPNISIGIGNAPPPPAPVTPRVCFFKGNNYSGAQFCVAPGTNDPQLMGGWDDSISSIQVQGGAQVTVCTNFWYAGSCTTTASSQPSLGAYNNAISSFQAF